MPSKPKPRTDPEPLPVAGSCWIPLTKGKFALIDEVDAAKVLEYNWCVCNGYAAFARRINGKYIFTKLHRFLTNPPEGMVVDHINGDTLDNRRSNLRICLHRENIRNQRPRDPESKTSRFKGVHWVKRDSKWRAAIKIDGKNKHIGVFESEEDAARAYDATAREIYGRFARLNFKE